MDRLIEDGAHRFEFNWEGTGCRAWVTKPAVGSIVE